MPDQPQTLPSSLRCAFEDLDGVVGLIERLFSQAEVERPPVSQLEQHLHGITRRRTNAVKDVELKGIRTIHISRRKQENALQNACVGSTHVITQHVEAGRHSVRDKITILCLGYDLQHKKRCIDPEFYPFPEANVGIVLYGKDC